MEGFRRVPSSITLFSSRYLYTVDMKRFWCTAGLVSAKRQVLYLLLNPRFLFMETTTRQPPLCTRSVSYLPYTSIWKRTMLCLRVPF